MEDKGVEDWLKDKTLPIVKEELERTGERKKQIVPLMIENGTTHTIIGSAIVEDGVAIMTVDSPLVQELLAVQSSLTMSFYFKEPAFKTAVLPRLRISEEEAHDLYNKIYPGK